MARWLRRLCTKTSSDEQLNSPINAIQNFLRRFDNRTNHFQENPFCTFRPLVLIMWKSLLLSFSPFYHFTRWFLMHFTKHMTEFREYDTLDRFPCQIFEFLWWKKKISISKGLNIAGSWNVELLLVIHWKWSCFRLIATVCISSGSIAVKWLHLCLWQSKNIEFSILFYFSQFVSKTFFVEQMASRNVTCNFHILFHKNA